MSDRVQELVALALRRVLAREARSCDGSEAPAPTAAMTPPPAAAARPAAVPAAAAAPPKPSTTPPEATWPGARGALGEVAIASDHGGFAVKEALVRGLRGAGYRVRDLGPATAESCDYPDYAARVARAVALGEAWRGIMVDGMGIGSAMACGKVPGVRAATCWSEASTRNSRGHNDANVLCLGSNPVPAPEALRLAQIFLDTAFEGGRHQGRVDKIVAIERSFTRAALAPSGGAR